MLVFAGVVHHLSNFCLSNFVRIHPTFTDTVLVDMQHHLSRSFQIHLEKPGKHLNHKFHRGEVIIQQQDAIQARFLDLGFGLNDDIGIVVTIAALAASAVLAFCITP